MKVGGPVGGKSELLQVVQEVALVLGEDVHAPLEAIKLDHDALALTAVEACSSSPAVRPELTSPPRPQG